MPFKGFFTQGAVILTERPIPEDEVDQALASFEVAKKLPAEGERQWMSGYPTWLIPYRREVNGLVVVDVVDDPWPDHMGHPSTKDRKEQALFVAWSMGFMGPFAWPGNLARAVQFAWAFGHDAAAEAAGRHSALVRVRSSYVLGAGDKAPILPEEYDARRELEFVTSVARALAHAPGALCYFNPNGETLYTPAELDESLEETRQKDLPPLPVWAQTRLMHLEDARPWCVVDTVGMGQLDADDQEACFREDRHEAGDVINFLRNTTLYVLQNGAVIKDGHTTDGPGGRWRAMEVEEALMPAPRPVLRWFPDDGSQPPAALRRRTRPKAAADKPGLLRRLKSMFGRRPS